MPRILVIDDQSDVRAMISIVLRVNHFDIVEAASGAAGLKKFENSKFDLAIVDIFLQGMNGFDVIRMMRERIPNLPIVAIGNDDARLCLRISRTLRGHMSAEAVSPE
jgi:CheY-like chemotaxis protein